MKYSDFDEIDFAQLGAPANSQDDDLVLFFTGVGVAAIAVLILGVGIGVGYAVGVLLG